MAGWGRQRAGGEQRAGGRDGTGSRDPLGRDRVERAVKKT